MSETLYDKKKFQTYMLEGIPRELWVKVKNAARRKRGIPMRLWILEAINEKLEREASNVKGR